MRYCIVSYAIVELVNCAQAVALNYFRHYVGEKLRHATCNLKVITALTEDFMLRTQMIYDTERQHLPQ